jgi:hypothetical protein
VRGEVCSSANQAEFTTEMMIHFSGRQHLANPGVLAFSTVSICLDCGYSRFNLSETELRLLREGSEPSKAAKASAGPTTHR